MTIYVIEDEKHAEWCGEYASFSEALEELRRRSVSPWDQPPNICPCTNWKNCGRNYEIIEFDNSKNTWEEISRNPVLEISAKGVVWEKDYKP